MKQKIYKDHKHGSLLCSLTLTVSHMLCLQLLPLPTAPEGSTTGKSEKKKRSTAHAQSILHPHSESRCRGDAGAKKNHLSHVCRANVRTEQTLWLCRISTCPPPPPPPPPTQRAAEEEEGHLKEEGVGVDAALSIAGCRWRSSSN